MGSNDTSDFTRRGFVHASAAGLAATASATTAQAAGQPTGVPMRDPRNAYAKPPFEEQSQPWPGLARDMDPVEAARLGALGAAEVIGHLGARPETSLRALAEAEGLLG